MRVTGCAVLNIWESERARERDFPLVADKIPDEEEEKIEGKNFNSVKQLTHASKNVGHRENKSFNLKSKSIITKFQSTWNEIIKQHAPSNLLKLEKVHNSAVAAVEAAATVCCFLFPPE